VSIGVHWASWETTQDALVCNTHGRELSFSLKASHLKSIHSQEVTWVKTLEALLNSHGRELSFSLKASHLKSIHSQEVTWVNTLEVLLNCLGLIGV